MLNSESNNLVHFVFYFPYKEVGGVPVLFLNVAKELSKRGFLTSVVDFSDGYMARNKDPKTSLICYESVKQIAIPENSILILQSDLPWGIPQNFICSSNTKIFFWNCYPFNLIPNLPKPFGDFLASHLMLFKIVIFTLLNSARIKTKKMLKLIVAKKAIAFMDFPNWSLTNSFLKVESLPEIYLPILVNSVQDLKPAPLTDNLLKVAWVGRIADFKIYPLLKILEDINQASVCKVQFIIIGSGAYEEFLKNKCKEFHNIKIEFITHLPYQDLHPYLNQNVDLLFAMGTTALDGGLSAIPTILMNFSYKIISNSYRYQFLYQTEKFSLGNLITAKNCLNGFTINEVIDLVLKNKKQIALDCKNYVTSHHLLEKKIAVFLDLVNKSELTYNQLIQSVDLERPSFYKIWSLIKKYL